ncbi:MAG: dihydrodipicolinate synthase family protein, partial [Gemmatimonadetes bacterium]|nr:dihydrodipicolinate synthase family protein [Gemmatimonadota bacterium]
YVVDYSPEQIQELAQSCANLHAVKESSTDVRRITALRAILGDRLTLLVGVDDAAVEGAAAGARGGDLDAIGDRDQRADVGARRQLAGQLGGAQDPRGVGAVDPLGLGCQRRRRADAPAVEVAARVRAEDLGALDEERPLLGERDLEGVEVDDRRIGLDLAEVGVEGGVEGEPGPEPELEVEAGVEPRLAQVGERVAGLEAPGAAHRQAGRHERQQLEAEPVVARRQAAQLAEVRRPAGPVLGHDHPEVVLAGRRHEAVEVDAPH